MKYTLFQESRIGKRPYQQDRLAHWHTREALFLVVADGMGGHSHGEVAAQITLDCMGSAFRNEAKPKVADPEVFLSRTISRAHAMIVHQTQRQGLSPRICPIRRAPPWSPAWCRKAMHSGPSSATRASTWCATGASSRAR